MRVSPCAWAFEQEQFARECITMADVESLAADSAAVTHNHPEGIKGAVETARAIWLMLQARKSTDYPKNIEACKLSIRKHSAYDLSFSLDEIRPDYRFDVSCQGSVPQAIVAFLESVDFEDAVRNAISIGGDSDTIAAITGGIAEAAYGIPQWIADKAWAFLDEPLQEICRQWQEWV